MIPARLRRPLFLAANALGLAAALFTCRQGEGGLFLLLALLLTAGAGEALFGFLGALRPTPYLGMLLAPLLLVHYSSAGDFRIRLACLIMLLYILVFACWPPRPRVKLLPEALPAGRAWLLSLLAFSLAAAALYAQGLHLSGDEPHYVMMAQSLVEDRDLDLKNNLDRHSYSAYMPVEIQFHGSVRQGRYHSFHLPGVSFLLVPFYYCFKLLGGLVPGRLYFRLAAALINSFFALGLFLALRRRQAGGDGGGIFFFFLLTFPLLFHAVHLFPELPAATLAIFAYLFARDERRYFLSGLLLAGIPWFHLKYAIPMLVLALSVMAWIWRRGAAVGEKARGLARFLAPLAASAALLALYSRVLYGSFNPAGISPEKNFFAIPLMPKLETLLSFFLDQRDGLLVYAPVLLLLFLAFRRDVRAAIRDFTLLAAMFTSYVLFHAFTTVRGAYSPAARPTLFVLWIMALFLAAFYRRAGETGKTVFRLLAGLGAFATVWFLYYPLFLYQPVTRDVTQRASALLLFLGSKAVDLAGVFPSFLKKPNAGYLPNAVWLAALAVVLVLYYSRRPRLPLVPAARWLIAALFIPLLFFLCFIPHVQLQTRYSAAGLSFFSNSRNFTFDGERNDFKARAGQDYDLFIDLDGSAAGRLDLRLLNPHGVTVKVTSGRRTLLAESRGPEYRVAAPLSAMQRFPLGKRNLVHLGLESQAGPGTVFFWLEFRR